MIPHRDRGFRLHPEIGHVQSESPVTLQRNDRSRSIGIVGHVAPETAVILVRNTHSIGPGECGAPLINPVRTIRRASWILYRNPKHALSDVAGLKDREIECDRKQSSFKVRHRRTRYQEFWRRCRRISMARLNAPDLTVPKSCLRRQSYIYATSSNASDLRAEVVISFMDACVRPQWA